MLILLIIITIIKLYSSEQKCVKRSFTSQRQLWGRDELCLTKCDEIYGLEMDCKGPYGCCRCCCCFCRLTCCWWRWYDMAQEKKAYSHQPAPNAFVVRLSKHNELCRSWGQHLRYGRVVLEFMFRIISKYLKNIEIEHIEPVT